MKTLLHLFGVAVAGGLGTLARYAITLGANVLFQDRYPWGTFIANMLGCFLFGVASGALVSGWVPSTWRVYILTGFLGGFTTFSAFAFESHGFLLDRRWNALAFHLLSQNLLGILAVLLGLLCVTRLLGEH